MVTTSLRHWTEIRRPAFDCLMVQPCKFTGKPCGGTHGRGAVELAWYVSGDTPDGLAVVQFYIFTGWSIDETPETKLSPPMPADLGFHWPTPRYKGQDLWGNDCSLLNGPCYYDGSGLNADEPWRLLRYEGDKALWAFLDDYWLELAAAEVRA